MSPLPLDSILVALINESALANAPAHRRAARIILEWLRTSRSLDGLSEGVISADLQGDVREHVRCLIEQHGLGRDAITAQH